MTASVARLATSSDHPLLDAYVLHCEALGCRDRAVRNRLRAARSFLAQHPDLGEWMRGPLPGRLVDLERSEAWPLIAFAVLTGRVTVDVDLLVAKDLGSFGVAAETVLAGDVSRARAAAERLGWASTWTDTVIRGCLTLILAWTAKPLADITVADLDAFTSALSDSPAASRWTRRAYLARLHACRQLLYECAVIDHPPKRGPAPATLDERLRVIRAPEIRRVIGRYIHTRAAVLAPKTLESLFDDLVPLTEFLAERFPAIGSLDQLERGHIEEFLTWNRTERTWRGRRARPQLVGDAVVHHTVITVRNFFDDLILWGWADAPRHQLLFATDIPRLPKPLPRALAPDADNALMAAVAQLDDLFARCAITICRRAGLRIGECLDLTLACVVDYGPTGSWLQVPLGKLATERSVPLDAGTVDALDTWTAQRGRQRPLPHPRTGTPTDFLFVERGHQLGAVRVRNALNRAARHAGLTGVTPHRLRHTFGTELINAGMSLQALMALMGHVTPEMTLRYATLASPVLRDAYDQAIGKLRRKIPVGVPGRPAVPERVAWIHSEYLKTRLAAGYCSRHLTADACPYANVCETCDNFTPTPEFIPVLAAQLDDIRELRSDADARGWTSETDRHNRVIADLETHLRRLGHSPVSQSFS
jgi:site-specific recombinase XerD